MWAATGGTCGHVRSGILCLGRSRAELGLLDMKLPSPEQSVGMTETWPLISQPLLADRLGSEEASPFLSPALLPQSPRNCPSLLLFLLTQLFSTLLPLCCLLSSLSAHPSSDSLGGLLREQGKQDWKEWAEGRGLRTGEGWSEVLTVSVWALEGALPPPTLFLSQLLPKEHRTDAPLR